MKKIIKVLWIFFAIFPSLALASDLDLPVPNDSNKISEEVSNFGPMISYIQVYKTKQSENRIFSFYKRELTRSGWKQRQEGVFIKDKYMAVILCDPVKDKAGLNRFNLTVSNIPTKEELLAMHKERPDKLEFMPVYPESEQIFLQELPGGMSSAYETQASLEEIVFFFKSGMLNYGWYLDYEKTLKSDAGMADCPECQQFFSKNSKKQPPAKNVQGRSTLIFRKEAKEICKIEIFESSALLVDSSKGKTNSVNTVIFVNYHANKTS